MISASPSVDAVTGNEDAESVALWASEQLGANRGVAYHLWDRY